MINKKLSGSFYTPENVATFLVKYLAEKLEDRTDITVLEPSAGDGVFVHAILRNNDLLKKVSQVTAVEKDQDELRKIGDSTKMFKGIHSDFLEFQENNSQKFTLVIGNPPYLKKSLLEQNQIDLCKSIHQNAHLADNVPKNIWTAFLVRCIEFTEAGGILAFVLPSELLQVKFAAELRELIISEFERVEIFTFNELLFKDCKGQDTLLLIGEKKAQNKGVYYCNIDKVSDMIEGKFTLAQNVKIKDSKWTHHHLETSEIELLERLRVKLKKADDFCSSKAGIVTGANDYFIVNEATVKKYSLQPFCQQIIQKGVFVNGSVVLTPAEFQILVDKSKPAYVIALNEKSVIRKNAKLWDYIKIGEKGAINTRYKTSIRNKWYEVPNIGTPPEAFFFKRCHEYPKLIKNSANVLATDSAYTIQMKESYQIENLIFSFYNSLTLAFAELNGRYYGGGVLELTPNEFKNLPVPHLMVSSGKFESFIDDFKSKDSIKDICKKNDLLILKSVDKDLDEDTISKLYTIREKLYLRRIKTN
jgi:adenine-specific DNA-methyltransferase